jgi:hypothetical protein
MLVRAFLRHSSAVLSYSIAYHRPAYPLQLFSLPIMALPLLFFAQPQLLGELHIRGLSLRGIAVASPCRALPQHIATA